jgi:acyl carrier protein
MRTQVAQALQAIAPEVDAASLDAGRPLRDQVDLDSMDFLRFVMELHRRTGVEVPEADYSQLASLGGAADYLAARAGSHRGEVTS